jgi:signal transduction histidine kinase
MSHDIHTRATGQEPVVSSLVEHPEERPVSAASEKINECNHLDRLIIEFGDRELNRLGQDLHDGICQQLVSIAFAADLVRRDLAAKSPAEAVRVARITGLLDSVITQARNLAHTLSPVSLVGNGLGVALRELATSISRVYRIACEVDCAEGVVVRDQAVAVHLYRIAQEAVHYAIKHAEASRILISLHTEGESISLSISDNGLDRPTRESRDLDAGWTIMKCRAAMAGGTVEMRRDPLAGTVVTCHCS